MSFSDTLQSKAERETKDDEDDNASVNSEEFNDFLDNMGGKSKDFKDEGTVQNSVDCR